VVHTTTLPSMYTVLVEHVEAMTAPVSNDSASAVNNLRMI
jgi:hypothetical protein